MGFRKYSESSLPIKKTFHLRGSKCNGYTQVLHTGYSNSEDGFNSYNRSIQLKSCFHILIFITTWKGECSNTFPDLGFKILTTIREIKILYTYIRIKMKNLNLHMECLLPMFSKTWAGRSVYNQISDCKLEVSAQEV